MRQKKWFQGYRFRVFNGSALATSPERFNALAGNGGPHGDASAASDAAVQFHSTVHHVRLLKHALLAHIYERSPTKSPKIAWLNEFGTTYGSHFPKKPVAPAVKHDPVNSSSNADDHIVEFAFPVNIARIRADYETERSRDRSTKNSLGPDRFRLPIPFDDLTKPHDMRR